MRKNKDIYLFYCDKYGLSTKERKDLFKMIKSIYFHKEFQRRFGEEFKHHGKTTLSEHIIEDTIVTYMLCKKSKKKVNTELAVKISMMHDLYTIPWQNNDIKKSRLVLRHGFAHPLEAAINSMVWFKKEFNNSIKSEILLDGILHHMYPLPVLSYKDSKNNELELFNYDMIKKLTPRNKALLEKLSNKYKIGSISLCRSDYLEGRIMSRADKLVSRKQLLCKDDVLALVTGVNNSIAS